MTLEREKYLAKCKVRELWLRGLIKTHKEAIKKAKEQLNYGVFDSDGQVAVCKSAMRVNKWLVACLRHELNHFKGMDRVVVPVLEYMEEDEGDGIIAQVDAWRCPKCGTFVGGYCWETSTYCMQCGRRILWEKVK